MVVQRPSLESVDPSALPAVYGDQEFSPEIVRIVRAIGIVTPGGENEHTLTSGFSRAGN